MWAIKATVLIDSSTCETKQRTPEKIQKYPTNKYKHKWIIVRSPMSG
jgi:hypothetical protein